MNVRQAYRDERDDVYEIIKTRKEIFNDEIVDVEYTDLVMSLTELDKEIELCNQEKQKVEERLLYLTTFLEEINKL